MTPMSIHMASDTRAALREGAENCKSRSLLFDRLSEPWAQEEARQRWFKRVFDLKPDLTKLRSWQQWLLNLASGPNQTVGEVLFAQLQSRLMVNMAGGVMENAGLCLDRFGVPYVPGSAVKGCARRMAIQRLLEAETPQAEDNGRKVDLLVNVALVFGWTELDWRTKEDVKPQRHKGENDQDFAARWQQAWKEMRSDFAYSCGDQWSHNFVRETRERLWQVVFDSQDFSEKAWSQRLACFAGAAAFLPAYPLKADALELPRPAPEQVGEMELDVVTCHHGRYYEDNPEYRSAPDTEDPNPVVFPAVVPGHVFVFGVLLPRRERFSCWRSLAPSPKLARNWLADGLSTFGLGAKTAAGYGWFIAIDIKLESLVTGLKETPPARAIPDSESRSLPASPPPPGPVSDEELDSRLSAMDEEKFRDRLKRLPELSQAEQLAFYRAMRGPRRAILDQVRAGQAKRPWSTVFPVLCRLAKQRGERMPS